MATLLTPEQHAMIARLVDAITLAIAAPITGVRDIDIDAKTATVDYRTTPTSAQLASAAAAITAFDWTAGNAAQTAWLEQQQAATVGRTSVKRLPIDASTTSGSFVTVPTLQFPLAPNTHYKFRFIGAYTAAAGTTGLQVSISGPASPTVISFIGQIFTAAGTILGGAGAAYDVAIAATASGGSTALPFQIEGSISTGASGGTLVLRARSEVAGSQVTLKAGSLAELAAAV